MKKAVITVIGNDKVGIIYAVSKSLSENNVNILNISQTIMDNMFTMIMLVDIEKCEYGFDTLSANLSDVGEKLGVEIRIQLEDIFNAMHRI